jgi:hypothetical protein
MFDIRVLKIATCKSLSGSSDLTYHLGCDAENNLHIRLWSNSAGGLHSKHWFSLAAILAKLRADQPITSGTLRPVCPGSRNNGGFILAALQQEGLVKPIPDLPHGVMPVEAAAYLAEMTKLMQQGAIQTPEPVNQHHVPLT